jgi:hypothetical protein
MAEVVGHLEEQGFPPLPLQALELLRAGHTLIRDYLGFVAPEDSGSGGIPEGVVGGGEPVTK